MNFVNDYGEKDETGYKTVGFYIMVEGGTMYFYLRNRSSGLQFQFVARGSEADRSDLDMSFVLTKYGNTMPVKFQTIYYEDHTYIDKVDTSVSINRTTFTIDSEYSVRGSTYISAEDATIEFNYGLQILCLFWESYFQEAFGFGLRDLGFTSYCYHDYANECDPDCSKCGETREVGPHVYSDEYINAGEVHHQKCIYCGYTIAGEHDWVPTGVNRDPTCTTPGSAWHKCTICGGQQAFVVPAAHDFTPWASVDDENHSRSCNACGEEETAPHGWDDGQIQRLPTADTPGLIVYTCSDCGLTRSEELNFIPGDIDGNGEVNRDDVVALLLHVSMPDAFQITIPADYNGDGQVTRDDVIQLLLHVSMPESFPLQ